MIIIGFDLTVLEFVGPAYRSYYGTGLGLVRSVGHAAYTGMAYAIRDDRLLQIAITVPNVAFLGFIW